MAIWPILRPGIDPGPLAWKASMQPLTLTEQNIIIRDKLI